MRFHGGRGDVGRLKRMPGNECLSSQPSVRLPPRATVPGPASSVISPASPHDGQGRVRQCHSCARSCATSNGKMDIGASKRPSISDDRLDRLEGRACEVWRGCKANHGLGYPQGACAFGPFVVGASLFWPRLRLSRSNGPGLLIVQVPRGRPRGGGAAGGSSPLSSPRTRTGDCCSRVPGRGDTRGRMNGVLTAEASF